MNKKKFFRILITIFSTCLIILIGINVYRRLNVEEATSVYPLYDDNIPIEERSIATNAIKALKTEMAKFQAYSPNIGFEKMYVDNVLAGAAKKDYLDKLNNPINKQYIDVLKRHLRFKVVHVAKGKYPKNRSENLRFCFNIEIKYIDIENNYKLYKNKQLLGTIDKNIDFVTYLNDDSNIELSQTYVLSYYIDYIDETSKYQLSSPDVFVYYMFQLQNQNQTIEDIIKNVIYDISNEPKQEEREKLVKAKAIIDKELEYIRAQNTDDLIEWLKNNINNNAIKKTQILNWIKEFDIKYAKTQIVQFLLETNKYEYIGYNNKKNTVVYAIKGYNYDKLFQMFNTSLREESEIDHKGNYNKFLIFKKALENKEYIKETRFIEVEVDRAGFTKPFIMQMLPLEKNIWDYNEVEYNGLVGIDVKDVPQDFHKYFKVTQVPGFANRAALVYISREPYREDYEATGNWTKYDEDCKKIIVDSLKIILDYEKNVNNTVYRKDFDRLVDRILQRIYSSRNEFSEEIDPKQSNLNGIRIRINNSGNSIAMTVRVDKWETE